MNIKNPYEVKYQSLIKHESVALNNCKDFKTFVKYSTDINCIYENIDKYNLNKNVKY